MLKPFKYRLYPTCRQKEQIDRTLGVCRLVYNLALETKIRAWQSYQKNITVFELCKQLPELKKAYPWMSEVNSQSLIWSVCRIEVAFAGFFSGNGFPKFKNKKGVQSFHCHNNTRRIDWHNATLTIPKIPNIPIKLSRKFDGQIKTVTISRTPTGKYFASILVSTLEGVPIKPFIKSETSIGIDLGIKSFATTSDGKFFEPNRFLKENLKRLQCLQRRASRKKKGSKNRKKANLSVALLHEKITNQRTDYIHKITTQLIRDNQTDSFMVENLNVRGLFKNEKLSRSIQDSSFAEFFRQIKYKCEWYGKNLIVIDRFAPSSKRCSDCGKINNELTLADRKWVCACGTVHDRDFNAAKNIKYFGLNTPVDSRGEPVESRRLRRAKKQELPSVICQVNK